jgi:hypothetical protein
MSFPSFKQMSLGYQAAIPALRTNENFTLEVASSIFGQVGFVIMRVHLPRPASGSCLNLSGLCVNISTHPIR